MNKNREDFEYGLRNDRFVLNTKDVPGIPEKYKNKEFTFVELHGEEAVDLALKEWDKHNGI
jgi:hypothetical protein